MWENKQFSYSRFSYLGEAVLSQCDELVFPGGTDVESNRQQALQSGNDKTRLHRVSISLPLHLLPLLVRNYSLRQSQTSIDKKCTHGSIKCHVMVFLMSKCALTQTDVNKQRTGHFWYVNRDSFLSMCPYLWHLTLGVSDEEGHVVDFILDHKVLLFSLEVLQKDDQMATIYHSTLIRCRMLC